MRRDASAAASNGILASDGVAHAGAGAGSGTSGEVDYGGVLTPDTIDGVSIDGSDSEPDAAETARNARDASIAAQFADLVRRIGVDTRLHMFCDEEFGELVLRYRTTEVRSRTVPSLPHISRTPGSCYPSTRAVHVLRCLSIILFSHSVVRVLSFSLHLLYRCQRACSLLAWIAACRSTPL